MSGQGKIRALLLALAVLAAIIAGLAYKFIVVGSTEKSADGRTAIVLAPAERDLVLAEMRGFVAALQQITAALAKDDMQAVAKAARGIGMAMSHEDRPRRSQAHARPARQHARPLRGLPFHLPPQGSR
jgi:hypothetical protein